MTTLPGFNRVVNIFERAWKANGSFPTWTSRMLLLQVLIVCSIASLTLLLLLLLLRRAKAASNPHLTRHDATPMGPTKLRLASILRSGRKRLDAVATNEGMERTQKVVILG